MVVLAIALSPIVAQEPSRAATAPLADDVQVAIRDIGPETGVSGSGSGFVFGRDGRHVVLATAQRVFGSLNGGNSWSPLGLTEPYSPTAPDRQQSAGSYYVRQDPQNPDVLFAATAGEGTLARSADFGKSWSAIDVGSFQFIDVAVHQGSSQLVLALRKVSDETAPALWRSEDGGKTFEPQWGSGLPKGFFDWDTGQSCSPHFTNITTTPTDPDVVYVAQFFGDDDTCPAAVHRSVDGGRTFSALDDSFIGGPLQVFPHPTQADVLFVQTSFQGHSSMYRSDDGGASFALVEGGLPARNSFVSFDPRDPGVVYVAGAGGVFRSRDGGGSFERLGLTPEQVGPCATNVNVDPSSSTTIYVNTCNGNFRSTNGGRTFTAINHGWRAAVIRAIAAGGGPGPALYAATDGGILRTRNHGATYEALPGPAELRNTQALAVAPSNPEMILAATGNGMFRTVDGGRSWTRSTPANFAISGPQIAIDPHDQRNVLVVGGLRQGDELTDRGVYRSADAGSSFALVEWTGGIASIAFDAQRPGVVHAGVGCTNGCWPLRRSDDGGQTFRPVRLDPGQFETVVVGRVMVDPTDSRNVFLHGYFSINHEDGSWSTQNLVRSTDGGATFAPIAPEPWDCTEAVLDQRDPTRLYCWSLHRGLAVTGDRGTTWQLVHDTRIAQLGPGGSAVLMDPQRPDRLYLLGNALLEVELQRD